MAIHVGRVSECFYCGELGDSRDHVIPVSRLQICSRKKNDPGITVTSCQECNILLGNTVQDSILERMKYAQEKIKKRYKNVLKCKDWTPTELKELSEIFRNEFRKYVRVKNIIQRRLEWPYSMDFVKSFEFLQKEVKNLKTGPVWMRQFFLIEEREEI